MAKGRARQRLEVIPNNARITTKHPGSKKIKRQRR